jgi:hypothetical protein
MIAAVRTVFGPEFHVDFPETDKPDPRLPSREVATVLWTYDEDGVLTREAKPTLPAPPVALAREISNIAEHPYALRVWSDLAAGAVKRLDAAQLDEVLAAMVNPPAAPSRIEPWDWYFRVQVAAALVVSHWKDSAGRSALEDIADGPADWTNTAAIIALFDSARRDETHRAKIIEALLRTARREMNAPTYQQAIRPAAWALLDLDAGSEIERELSEMLVDA